MPLLAPALDAAAQARREKVNAVWSADSVRDAGTLGQYWLAHPLVRARVNALASGQPDMDAYGWLAQWLAARGWALPISRAVSLGCGFGALERDLAIRDLVRSMEALDLAEAAIAEARRLAEAAGLRGIHYRVADLESAALPPSSADVVFAHQSVHHVEALDELFLAVARALRPGGVFHLHEFVGPARFQWTDAQLDLANGFLDSLPPRLRRLASGEPKGRLRRPTIAEMVAADPTEAIRSADILGTLGRYFRVAEVRRLGGAVVHIALGGIAQNFDPDSPEDRASLERLFAVEDAAMADGRIGSDFVTVTAVRRRLPRAGAVWRQLALPRNRTSPVPRAPAAGEAPFDEAWYLDVFPDVRAAVAEGIFASGHEHWIGHGRAEGRPGSPNAG